MYKGIRVPPGAQPPSAMTAPKSIGFAVLDVGGRCGGRGDPEIFCISKDLHKWNLAPSLRTLTLPELPHQNISHHFAFVMILRRLIPHAIATCATLASAEGCWRDTSCSWPTEPSFPGPWDENNFAPDSRHVSPRKILALPTGEVIGSWNHSAQLSKDQPEVVLDFGIEVGGIVTIDYSLTGGSTRLGLAFTEAKNWIGRRSDNSNGGGGADGALLQPITAGNGSYTMPDAKLRGGFRYLTLFLEDSGANGSVVDISSVSLELSFQPTWSNLRAYQGYFHSDDDLVNRIWYSGAYTIQTNCVPSRTGRVPTDIKAGWQNDEFIGPGDTVLLDGAKRDRWVWIGDMGTAVSSAFVSTGDVESTKNALLAIYNYQADNGVLPKAGPPYLARDSDSK